MIMWVDAGIPHIWGGTGTEADNANWGQTLRLISINMTINMKQINRYLERFRFSKRLSEMGYALHLRLVALDEALLEEPAILWGEGRKWEKMLARDVGSDRHYNCHLASVASVASIINYLSRVLLPMPVRGPSLTAMVNDYHSALRTTPNAL